MAIDVLTFPNNTTPLDLLLYRTYGRQVKGLVESTLKQNPGLAALGPYPPAGTTINVTVPAAKTKAGSRPVVKLYG